MARKNKTISKKTLENLAKTLAEVEIQREKNEMKMERSKNMKIGFLNILTIIFVIAKLFKVIDWSWWLVLLPSIINMGFMIFVLLIALFAIATKYTKGK